eukprot:g4719.t1
MSFEAGEYLRFHLEPKRFPKALSMNWVERILFENDEFIVVDKPQGVPCLPTLDNAIENVQKQLQNLYERKAEIIPTTRLDVCTKGLLILAKQRRFQTFYNKLIEEGKVTKEYVAVVYNNNKQIEKGHLVHYMRKNDRSPKEIKVMANEQENVIRIGKEKWRKCELFIKSVSRNFSFPSEEIFNAVAVDEEAHEFINDKAFKVDYKNIAEVKVELITGRTHQIRAQLAAAGLPLIGDPMYNALHKAMQSRLKTLENLGSAEATTMVPKNWETCSFDTHNPPLLLQCCKLKFAEFDFKI